MKAVSHAQLDSWLKCHGVPLQLGLMVKVTDECQWSDFNGGEFMITSLSFDKDGVNIGINDDGRHDDFATGYDGFRINELQPA